MTMYWLKEWETFPPIQYLAGVKKSYTSLIYLEGLFLGVSWIILGIFPAIMHFGYKEGERA